MRELLKTKVPTRKVDFMGVKNAVEVKKLSGQEVKEFTHFINVEAKNLPESEQGLAIQYRVVRMGVLGADDLSDDELLSFPLDDVSSLAKAVLAYSGLGTEESRAGNA